jgi:hypothetical protein
LIHDQHVPFYVLAFLESFHCYNIILESMCSYFTSDTYANGHSACAAKLAAGLCADLASLILSGRVRNGFALVLSDDLIDFFFHLTFFLCMLHHDGTWELSINLLCISLVHDSDHALCPCLPEDM